MSEKVKQVVYYRLEKYCLNYCIDRGYHPTENDIVYHILHEANRENARLYSNLSLLELAEILGTLLENGVLMPA